MPAGTATFDIVKQNATVDDTLRTIINAVNQCSKSPFVQTVVRELGGPNPPDKLQFIKNLFGFICRNLKYQLDIPGVEEVWTPELTLREKIYDCKKGSVFIGSVLAAAGIDPILKHVYYSAPGGGLQDYTHIYVIVPESSMRGPGAHTMEFVLSPYITVDTTNDCKFNAEVNHKTATLYFLNGKKMELHMMGNPNARATQTAPGLLSTSAFSSAANHCARKLEDDMRATCRMPSRSICGPADYEVDLIGLKNQYFSYTVAEATAHTTAVIVMAPLRGAFLGLLWLGKFLAKTPLKLHMAKRLAQGWQKDPNKMRKWWWKKGGSKDANALKTAIIKGSGISISGPAGYGYDFPLAIDYRTADFNFQPNAGMGAVTLATASAALALAAPLIVSAKALMKELGVFKEGDTDPEPPPSEPAPEPPPPPPAPGPSPQGLSILSVSTPINTTVKAIFLMGISSMFTGFNFYALNICCAAAISISIIKYFSRK